MILLILLFAYSTVMFLKGKSAAEHDDSLPQEKVETFNGVKSSNGAKNILILGSDTWGRCWTSRHNNGSPTKWTIKTKINFIYA